MVHLTVCYYHVTNEVQSESTIHSLPQCQGTPCWKQLPYLKFKWQQWDFNLIYDMIIAYNQMHHADKYSQLSSIIWAVWLKGWVFIYELSGFGFKSHCSHLNFSYGACFEQGVPWHSGKILSVGSLWTLFVTR